MAYADLVMRATEIQHREVSHDEPQIEPSGLASAWPAGGVVAGSANHIDFAGNERPYGMAGYEVAVGMVDGVSRQAAHPQQGGLRLSVVSHDAEVRLAEAVDLRRHDHRVTAAAPQHIERARVGHPALDHGPRLAAGAGWNRLRREITLSVRHHELMIHGKPGESGGEPRYQCDAGSQHFTGASPRLGGGADAQLGEGVRVGGCPVVRWADAGGVDTTGHQNTGAGIRWMRSIPPTAVR